MAKSEKTPNVTSDHGVVGLEYTADKFRNPDGTRKEDADGKKLRGAQHWYAYNERGTKDHITEEEMLEKFGYRPEDYQGMAPETETSGSVIPGNPEVTLDPSDLSAIQFIEIVDNARNFIIGTVAEDDENGAMRIDDETYPAGRELTPEEKTILSGVFERVAKEKFGIDMSDPSSISPEDLKKLDALKQVMQMTSKEYDEFRADVLGEEPLTDEVVPGAPERRSDEEIDEEIAREFRERLLTEEKIVRLEKTIESLTLHAVEFEKSGKIEDRDNAFWTFADLFNQLGDLKGWSDEDKAIYLDAWKAAVEYLLTKDQPPTDPGNPPADPPDGGTPGNPGDPLTGVAGDIVKSPELVQLEVDLANARDTLAKLNVKASGRIRIGRKLKGELEEAHKLWQSLQVQAGTEALKYLLQLDGTLEESGMRYLAKQGALNESEALRQAQALAVENGPDGGRIKKFMHNYARKYNEAGRFKKALMLAPAGLLVGVGVGTIIGAVGGGIGAALVSKGAVKSALTAKMQALRARNAEDLDLSSLDYEVPSDEAMREQFIAARAAGINRIASERFVRETSRENKGRMAKALSIGTIVGIASGMAANAFMDQPKGVGGGLLEKVTGRRPIEGFSRPTGAGRIIDIPEAPLPPAVPSVEMPNILDFAGSKGVNLGAPDAWPFKVADGLGLSEQDSIGIAERAGFSFREGKYWVGSRMMNPEEMKWHNMALAELAAKRSVGAA